ncbi:energy transducer TonB [Methylobacillus sp.]|uniref:energy transducer TonB n=1 Tax=Methylobacillus sp. TaxID=56818 RepID=UPI002FE2EF52
MSIEFSLARLATEQFVEAPLIHQSTRSLVPKRISREPGKQDFSIKGLVTTIAIHGVVFAFLVVASTREIPPEKEAAPPIMVSLVKSPEPVPEVPIVEPPPQPKPPEPKPQPKPKPKPKPVPKVVDKPVPIEAPKPVEPVVEETVEAEIELQPSQAAPQVPAQAPVQGAPVEAEKVAPAPRPEPKEQAILEVPISGVSYRHQEMPTYPAMSKRLGEQGVALLRINVSETGMPETIQLEKSSGFDRLDKAALEAAKKCRFNPYMRDNKPMRVTVIAPFRFSLSD